MLLVWPTRRWCTPSCLVAIARASWHMVTASCSHHSQAGWAAGHQPSVTSRVRVGSRLSATSHKPGGQQVRERQGEGEGEGGQ